MGAELIYTESTDKLSDQVKKFNKKFKEAESEHRDNYDGYSGSFYEFGGLNQKPYEVIAKDYHEAHTILRDKHQKWEKAMIVNMTDGTSLIGGWASS